MSRKRLHSCLAVVSVVIVSARFWPAACAEPPGPSAAVSTPEWLGAAGLAGAVEPEVLEKGPIHEAFAEPLTLDRPEPLVVTKQPPAPINELPPDEQPTGRNIQWLNGYWAFHEEVDDFVWVSGLWRDMPPGREWFAGEWHAADGGYVWSPGFWAQSGAQEVQYVPTPPRSLEQGPSSPAPGDNYLWTPGCWRYERDEYLWQPGFGTQPTRIGFGYRATTATRYRGVCTSRAIGTTHSPGEACCTPRSIGAPDTAVGMSTLIIARVASSTRDSYSPVCLFITTMGITTMATLTDHTNRES